MKLLMFNMLQIHGSASRITSITYISQCNSIILSYPTCLLFSNSSIGSHVYRVALVHLENWVHEEAMAIL